MTKHLRLIMLSLLAMICLGGYSQSETVFKTLSFPDDNQTNNKVSVYNNKAWTAKIGNDEWSIKYCNNNNWNNWTYIAMGSKDAKSVASIATTTELAAAITKVVVNYNKAENLAKNLNSIKLIVASDKEFKNDVVTIEGDKSFSTATPSTFTITTPAEKRYFKLEYDLNKTVNEKGSAKNGMIRIKSIEYFSKPASSKTPTTTTFGADYDGKTFNFVDGVLEGWKALTATHTPADVAGTTAYESDNEAVATVDAKGQLTFNGYGTAKITATFTPNKTETYAESTASYTVINKEGERTPTAITFGVGVDNNTFEVKDGDTFEAWVAKCTTEGATGSIQYSSSDEAIAKVDATTGAITLGAKYGTAVITAKFVATGSFANSEASYSIKHVGDFVFYESFDKCDGTGGNDGQYSGNIASNKCENENLDESWERTGRVYAANKCLRVGKDGTATTRLINITGKAVLLFKTAAWKGDNSNINLSINGGTLNYDGTASESIVLTPTEAKWEDFEIEITSTKPFTLSFHSDKRFFLDDVMVIAKEITLDENGDNTVEKAENVNVTLKRTLYGDGGWNTLCVPFSLTAAQVKAAFGNDVELRKLSSIEGTTLKFVSTDIITAGEPCLIKVAKDGSTYNFEGVATIAVANNKDYTFSMVSGDIQFLGIYSPMDVVTENPAGPSTGYYAFLGEGNKFFKAQAETKMKGFRAFFLVPNNVPSNALKAVIDGTATGIEDLVIDGVKANGHVYNLNGQYVGNSLNGLQSGIYIQNGKKIVVK